mgnify:CR=1 FL=1
MLPSHDQRADLERQKQVLEMVCTAQGWTFDVLADMEIRQGIKEYSEWPTIPQVYVKGEFLGGSDILIEMYNSGELREKLAEEAKSYQVPSNKSVVPPPQSPKLEEIKLIDYDFAKYGSSAERKRLLTKWDNEVKKLPK